MKAERMKEAEVRAKEVKTEEEAESQWRNAVGKGREGRGGEVIFYVKWGEFILKWGGFII